MDYFVSKNPDESVIQISGRFTHADRRAFQDALSELDGVSSDRLVLDFSETDFIDSSALGMLLLVQDRIGEKCRLVLRGAKGQVKNLFDMTRFSEMFLLED